MMGGAWKAEKGNVNGSEELVIQNQGVSGKWPGLGFLETTNLAEERAKGKGGPKGRGRRGTQGALGSLLPSTLPAAK